MKKTVLTLMAVCAIATATQAQKRECGTTNYYEFRKQQDPNFERRMQENEKQIQEWIKQHPTANEIEAERVHLPSIEGFHVTGNIAVDRENYAVSKWQYLASKGTIHYGIAETEKVRSMREEKRKSNSFIQK